MSIVGQTDISFADPELNKILEDNIVTNLIKKDNFKQPCISIDQACQTIDLGARMPFATSHSSVVASPAPQVCEVLQGGLGDLPIQIFTFL